MNEPKKQLAVREAREPSIALMLEKVIDKGVTAENVSALEALVGLYDRMQAKQAEKDFATAFSALQSEIPRVVGTKPVPNKDGTVRFRYAPFEEILEQVQPFLSKHGFSLNFDCDFSEGRMTSTCTLRHISGHSEKNRFSVRIGNGPPGSTDQQADVSAKSYAKRGALSDALNVVVDHSDDARMIGKPIDKDAAGGLRERVWATKSDELAFLRFAGIQNPTGCIEEYYQISEERYDALDEILRRKEGKLI